MMLDSFSNTLLQKSLDGLWQRQQAILNNLANYETPNYKKKYVEFEKYLKQAIDESDNKTKSQKISLIDNTHSYMGTSKSETLRADGNNVDVEQENIELARAQLQYSTAIRQVSDNLSRLRSAISGTSR
ncbi:MAG: flagellar basal body rod protein FlgB [Oscillospiraceae bacterium]